MKKIRSLSSLILVAAMLLTVFISSGVEASSEISSAEDKQKFADAKAAFENNVEKAQYLLYELYESYPANAEVALEYSKVLRKQKAYDVACNVLLKSLESEKNSDVINELSSLLAAEYSSNEIVKILANSAKTGVPDENIVQVRASVYSKGVISLSDSMKALLKNAFKRDDSVFYKEEIEAITDVSIVGNYMWTNLDINNDIFSDIIYNKDTSEYDYSINGIKNTSSSSVLSLADFSKFTSLEKLEIKVRTVSSFSSLSSLENLVVLGVEMSSQNNLEGIDSLKQIKVLNLSHNNISNISPLSSLTSLKELRLQNNKIIDISSLSQMLKLSVLLLNDNSIASLDSLEAVNAENLLEYFNGKNLDTLDYIKITKPVFNYIDNPRTERFCSIPVSCLASQYAALMGVSAPSGADKSTSLICDKLELLNGTSVANKLIIYHAESISMDLYTKHTADFAPIFKHCDLSLPLLSTNPATTRYSLEAMFKGSAPSDVSSDTVRGTVIDTLADSKKVAVITVGKSSIFDGNNKIDYYYVDSDTQAADKAISLASSCDVILILANGYDNAIKATNPEEKSALDALKGSFENYSRICSAIKAGNYKNVVVPFTSSHGCYWGENYHGSYGNSIPEDMNLMTFYSIF